MSEQHPEILYRLHQVRIQEWQQEAACARLAAPHKQTWKRGWHVPLMGALIGKVALLLTPWTKKPIESCC